MNRKMTVFSRKIILPFTGVLLIVCIGTLLFLTDYERGLHPRLVAIIPIKDFPTSIDRIGQNQFAMSYEYVAEVLRAKHISCKHIVALQGIRIVRLQPDSFHEVKGKIVTENADTNLVYVYKYNKRYEPLVRMP